MGPKKKETKSGTAGKKAKSPSNALQEKREGNAQDHKRAYEQSSQKKDAKLILTVDVTAMSKNSRNSLRA